MSRWLPSFVSVQPGVVRPRLVTGDQVLLAAKAAIAAGLAWGGSPRRVIPGDALHEEARISMIELWKTTSRPSRLHCT